MINFKNLMKNANPERMEYVLTIEGSPVWDYKIGALNTIFLISEDPWQGVEEEYVKVAELRKYIVSNEIPFDLVKLQTETDRETLLSYKWIEVNKELYLSHYK